MNPPRTPEPRGPAIEKHPPATTDAATRVG